MVITSNDSKGLREIYKDMQRKGIKVQFNELSADDGSFASIGELLFPNMTINGKWDLNLTKILTTLIDKYYDNQDKKRQHELNMKNAEREHELKLMKLVIIRKNGTKEIVETEAIEQGTIEPPKENEDKVSIEEVTVES